MALKLKTINMLPKHLTHKGSNIRKIITREDTIKT